MIRDQYHGDPRHTFLLGALEASPEAFEQLKTASFDADIDRLPETAFAWPAERRYPVHTPHDALASLVYRSKHAGAVPPGVDATLAAAVQAYGLTPVLSKMASDESAPGPQIEITYALPERQRLPLHGLEQIKVAEEVLHRDRAAIPRDEAQKGFARIYKAAAEQGIPLSNKTAAFAGVCPCDTVRLGNQIGERAALTKVAAAAEAFTVLERHVAALPSRIYDAALLSKFAERLAALDEIADVSKHYGKRLEEPQLAVFNAWSEKAAMGEELCDLGGAQVPVQTLMQLPAQIWEQLDMPELGQIAQSGDAAQFKTVFDTVPLDIKMVLARQLGQ